MNGTYCSQIGDLEQISDHFLSHSYLVKVSFLNKANNRARADLLWQVWLYLTVMNFVQY